jgi:beta-lactamase superfamily II metal-dependent hydrolase
MKWLATWLFLAALAVRAATPGLEIYWIDVEGGGATLIVTPARQSILIDTGWATGPSVGRIHDAAAQAGVTRIDYLIVTHFHLDHYGGAAGLAQLMPIGIIIDNGIPERNPDGLFDGGAFNTMIQPYRDLKATKRLVMEPGQTLQLWQVGGTAPVSYRCLGAHQRFVHAVRSVTNTICGTGTGHEPDTTDNKNSIVSLVQFGAFKFFDGGDLTWNMEKELVCPVNEVRTVDVYQTDHHGVDLSNNPLLVRSLAPTVSVMNNGPRKGGAKLTLATLRSVASIQTMFQVHKDIRGGAEFNTDDQFIANVDAKCAGNFIKCSIDPSGNSYTISIPAKNFARTYQTRAAKP